MTTVCTHWRLRIGPAATSVVGCSRGSGAEVFVGSRHIARPSDPDACEVPLDALVRTVTDARGRYRIGVPRDSAGPAANCVLVLASLTRYTLRMDAKQVRSWGRPGDGNFRKRCG